MKKFQTFTDIMMSIFVCLFPVFLCLPSLTYLMYLDSLHWASCLLFYIFLLIHSFNENDLTMRANPKQAFVQWPNPLLTIINVGLIISFGIRYNIWLALLLLAYSLMIHVQLIFIPYGLSGVGLSVLAFFKAFIPPMALFYIHVNFIPQTFIAACLMLVIPIFMVNYNRWQRKVDKHQLDVPLFKPNLHLPILYGALFLANILATLISWRYLPWLALIFLGVPFLTFYWHHVDQKPSVKSFVRQHYYIFMAVNVLMAVIYFLTRPS